MPDLFPSRKAWQARRRRYRACACRRLLLRRSGARKLFHRKGLVAATHDGFFHTKDFSALKTAGFNGPTRVSAGFYDAIVGVLPVDAAKFAEIAPKRTSIIENGCDLEKFGGASSSRPVKRMLALGRFSSNKRPERLIASLGELVRDDLDWRLDVVGAESDWTAEMLNDEIATAGLAGHVALHVGLDDAGVAKVMRGAALFVSDSDYEGFGVALIEAMSAGLGAVVHPNAAFAGLAARHKAIRTVDFADAPPAAAAIRETFAALPADPTSVRASAAELDDYAWPRVAVNYMRVYHAALMRRNGAAAAQRPSPRPAGSPAMFARRRTRSLRTKHVRMQDLPLHGRDPVPGRHAPATLCSTARSAHFVP